MLEPRDRAPDEVEADEGVNGERNPPSSTLTPFGHLLPQRASQRAGGGRARRLYLTAAAAAVKQASGKACVPAPIWPMPGRFEATPVLTIGATPLAATLRT